MDLSSLEESLTNKENASQAYKDYLKKSAENYENGFGSTLDKLENFAKYVPKGSIIAFDELNMKTFPGETLAVLECLDIKKIKIKRFIHGTAISYAQL